MTKIREEEVKELKNQNRIISENFEKQRRTWDTVLEDKNIESDRIRRKADEDIAKYKE